MATTIKRRLEGLKERLKKDGCLEDEMIIIDTLERLEGLESALIRGANSMIPEWEEMESANERMSLAIALTEQARGQKASPTITPPVELEHPLNIRTWWVERFCEEAAKQVMLISEDELAILRNS